MASLRGGTRILFTNKTAPDKGGGMEQRLREMSARLAQDGCEILYLCARTEIDQQDRYLVDGINVRALSLVPKTFLNNSKVGFYLPRLLFVLLSFFVSILLIRDFKPQLIVDSVSPLPSAAIVAARIMQVPVVLDYPEYFCPEGLSLEFGGPGFLAAILQYFALQLEPDGVVAMSTFTERRLRHDVRKSSNLLMVPGGLKTSQQKPHSAPGKRPADLLSVSRLVPTKQVDDILRMMALLDGNEDVGKLAVVGSGPQDVALKALAEDIGVRGVCRFLGYLKGSPKWELFDASQLFVTASRREGFGISVLEAMSFGLPIISYDIPPINEIISTANAGLIMGAERPEDLASCVTKVLSDKALHARIGEANRLRAEEYSYDNVAPAYLRFLLSFV